MKYSTVSELRIEHPNLKEAMQFVCVSEVGEIHQWVMPVEAWHTEMPHIMTSYSFVNGWFVYSHTITL